ncbi:hypothetical protein PIB30_072464, partial [Stylosanthes scabra]|nr:hypothetical protein [Stylosanthes scabra]
KTEPYLPPIHSSTSRRHSPWWTASSSPAISSHKSETNDHRLLQHRESHCAATTVLADSNVDQPRAATTVLAVTPFAIFSPLPLQVSQFASFPFSFLRC